MTCAICHIAPHPLFPPDDPEAPQWENLSATIGNQYFREGQIFASGLKEGDFLWEMINAQPPGTSDTSRIATDHMNNPNAINAIFLLAARQSVADAVPTEAMASPARLLPGGDNGYDRHVPHILKDGSDSVGIPGATIRVFINIGMYSEHWLEQHNPLVGVFKQKPFSIELAQRNSVYWRATEERLTNIAKFFMKIEPFHLADAPGGKDHIDDTKLNRGMEVFAENCARCHSGKQPADGQSWTELVKTPGFLDNNFLSDEQRYPVTELLTNSARSLGTNAKRGHIWDNFSSESYKNLPSVGTIDVYNLLDPSTPLKFQAPAGGVGYYRTPSLISIWTSAPFLHNNLVGTFTGDPSVAGRLEAFDSAVEQLLWPDKRKGPDSIRRTTQESYLKIPASVLPAAVRGLLRNELTKAAGLYKDEAYLEIGPIPKGTPMDLLLNLDLAFHQHLEFAEDLRPVIGRAKELVGLALSIKKAMLKTKGKDADEAKKILREELLPVLIEHSNCPDFVEDRGHYFGIELPDDDKLALIEFLKTL
jgi:cytochrome c1